MLFENYNLWQSCLLVPGISRAECASWVQAWGSIGALGIAVGIQYLSKRDRGREQQQVKLEAIHSAIVLSASIANVAMAVKKQHVLPAVSELAEGHRRLAAHLLAQAASPQPLPPFELEMNPQSLPVIDLPIQQLFDLTVLRIATSGKAVVAACEMRTAYVALQESIKRRNDLLAHFASDAVPAGVVGFHYLGIKYQEHQTDRLYPDLVNAMLEYANQIAFHGAFICDQLTEHAKVIREKCGPGVFTPAAVDFSEARASGLLPPDSDFQDWLKGFGDAPVTPAPNSNWIARARSWISSWRH